MHDNLRLQRMVQQLANKVRKLMEKQGATDTEPHESHLEIMALAEATFKEMSLQVNTALPDPMQRCGNQCMINFGHLKAICMFMLLPVKTMTIQMQIALRCRPIILHRLLTMLGS